MLSEENNTELVSSPDQVQTSTPPEAPESSNIEQAPSTVKKSGGKSKWLVGFLAVAILLFVGGIGGYVLMGQTKKAEPAPTPTQAPQQVACTMEAKLCPDGITYVSRGGPKCEFQPCPTGTSTSAETTSWKTYTGTGFSFKYPSDWKFYAYGEKTEAVQGAQFGEYFLSPITSNSASIQLDIVPSNQTTKKLQEQTATTVLENGSYFYSFTALDKQDEIFKKILSTFKFTQ